MHIAHLGEIMSPTTLLRLVLISICGLTAACSSPGRNYTSSLMNETLEIEILPNTSKMFVYRLAVPEEKIPRTVHIARGGNDPHDGETGGISVGNTTQARLHENAGYVVKQMGYCKEGFLEIDSSASRYHLWLKGECKDGATDEDRQKFGTKKVLPVQMPH